MRGPKNLQLNEFANQLDQYAATLGWDWARNVTDLPNFLENTIRLIHTREDVSTFFQKK